MAKVEIDNKKMWESILKRNSVSWVGTLIKRALKDQGLEYKDGKIASILKIDTGKFYVCNHSINGYESFTCGKIYKSLYDNALINDNGIEVKIDENYLQYFRPATEEEIPHEPKFHEGQWIIHQGTENIYQVVAIIDNQYQLKYGDNYTVQKCVDVDRCARLWDITKDAKDGDVLHCWIDGDEFVLIYKGVKDGYFTTYGHLYQRFKLFAEEPTTMFCRTIQGHFTPATKEQRDILFQKMKEAGYEWDVDKKELKKIEQKPATMSLDEAIEHCKEKSCGNNACALGHKQLAQWLKELKGYKEQKIVWSEEDEKVLDNILYILNQLKDTTPYKEDKTAKECIDWLKSIKDRVQPQPKQEWSEEDESWFKEIELMCLNFSNDTDYREKFFTWLKSLKGRVGCEANCTTTKEWSEEDKTMIENIIDTINTSIEDCDVDDIGTKARFSLEKERDWLKSLRPQTTWKPSEEQMDALEHFVRSIGESGYASPYNNNTKLLYSLLEQLKKLKE